MKTVIFWNSITISNKCILSEYIFKCNIFLWCSAEFSATLLESSVSHDPSEIILLCRSAAQDTFISIINVEYSRAASYFSRKHVFTATLDPFNASLLNKSINFSYKSLTHPKHLKGIVYFTQKWKYYFFSFHFKPVIVSSVTQRILKLLFGFGTTLWWFNYDRIFIFGWSIPSMKI